MMRAVNDLEESLASASATQWQYTGSANFKISDSTSHKWSRIKENALAGWIADTVIKRVADIFTEWCLAGDIRYSSKADAGWVAATVRRLFPDGFFNFFVEYIFHWAILGEFYFLPKFDGIGRLTSYELVSPLEVTQVEHDDDSSVYARREWIGQRITVEDDNININANSNRRVYSNREMVMIKWNSSADRGLPFVHQLVAWIMVYNEWLKDRAITNRMRSFAFLKRTIDAHSGVAKTKADQFSSDLMHDESYKPGRHDQYGYGYKKEKMPTGGILTCDANENWEPITFPIQGDDASPDGHAFRQQCCNLTGIPEALLYGGEGAKLDTADSRVESFVRKIEFIRTMFVKDVNAILDHCRKVELVYSDNISVSNAGRRVDTRLNFHFKPAAVGERRFVTEDLNKSMIAGTVSRYTAMQISPFVSDPDEEEKRIQSESGSELGKGFLDRISTGQSNRDDEDADIKKKQKDAAVGTRGKERDTRNTSGEET